MTDEKKVKNPAQQPQQRQVDASVRASEIIKATMKDLMTLDDFFGMYKQAIQAQNERIKALEEKIISLEGKKAKKKAAAAPPKAPSFKKKGK